jgi:alpha-L-rhamnosidase
MIAIGTPRRKIILVLCLAVIFFLLTACSDFVDQDQIHRKTENTARLEAGHPVGQTFVARHGGLNGVEIWLEPGQLDRGTIQLHLKASPQAENDWVTVALPLAQVKGPGFYRFSFPPRRDSHGKYFYAFLEIDGDTQCHRMDCIRVGAGPGDVYLDGALYYDHEPLDAQMTFRLVYAPGVIVLDLIGTAIRGLGLLAVSGLLYIVPGWALLAWLWPERLSWAEMLGLAPGLSLALYPLLLLWTDLLGVHLGPLYAWLPVLGGLVALARRYRSWRPRGSWPANHVWPDLTFIFVMGLVFAVRLLVVRTLDAPLWGDSYQHTMMAQLLVDNGGLFDSWEPYAPYRSLTVHFGFPLATALFSWFTGLASLQATFLVGQIVNGLAVLTIYPLAVRLADGNRWAGVGAVLVAGLLSPVPADYVNWGRYAQLAGQVILPVAICLLCETVRTTTTYRTASGWKVLLLAGVTLAGMMLNYYRAPFYYAAFFVAWLIAWMLPHWGANVKAWFRGFLRLAGIAGIAMLFFAPWVLHIADRHLVGMLEAGSAQSVSAKQILGSYQAWRQLGSYVPKHLLIISLIGLLWSLMRRRWSVVAIGLWAGGLASLVAARLIKLPGANLMQHFAIMIALYIPVSLLLGWLIGGAVALLREHFKLVGQCIGAGIIGGIALWSVGAQVGVVQPSYMLVTRSDMRAMAWIREHTPVDARFLVEGFRIYDGWSAVGADAGWWIPLLAGRENTMPPQYALMNEAPVEPGYTQRVVDLVARLEQTPPVSPAGVRTLCDWGITHVYIGQRQGKVGVGATQLFSPNSFIDSVYFQQVYHQDRVYVLAMDQNACDTVDLVAEDHALSISPSNSGDFAHVAAIWPHDQAPAMHEVALFRHKFALERMATQAHLSIFADTRYEVWLDGRWLGRGPARFSKHTHEYDKYALEAIQPGSHLLAVLVQWAPNARRSVSVSPLLQVKIEDQSGLVTQTSADWKAKMSDAWRKDAVPVHTWGILGPTELLDLRLLPANWMTMEYADENWPTATVKDVSPAILYRPRSIPFLTEVPITPTIRDVGLLSVGRDLYEVPPSDAPYQYQLRVITDTTVTIEMLSMPSISLTETVRIDDEALDWQPVPSRHPDVRMAGVALTSGTHSLAFTQVPQTGLTLGISKQNTRPLSLSLQQGRHAGRRLLLAEPVSQTIESVALSEYGIMLAFNELPAYAVLDLGRVVHGRLRATVEGASGAILDIGWDERLWQGRRPLPYPGSLYEEWNQTDSWIMDGTPRTIATIDARAGRYVLIAAWGNSPVKIDDLRIYEERYPVTQRGTFTSSNSLMNEVWRVGVDTLYANMTDAYADPFRERGQWWGDTYVAYHMNLAAFGDMALLRRGVRFMAEAFGEDGAPPAFAPYAGGEMTLFDYGMLWVQSVKDYWQLTEDRALLTDVYPSLMAFMAYLARHENPETGLLDISEGHWSQTAVIDWAASHYDRHGQSTVMNAFYHKTLVDAAAIASAVEDTSNAVLWQEKGELIKHQVNTLLYMENYDRYAVTLVGGKLVEEDPYIPRPHPQAWALANEVVPQDRIASVVRTTLDVLSSDPMTQNIEIYGMFWLLDALGKTGHITEAINVIENYYGYLLDLGATTWWEHFDSHLRYNASLSHAWGGAPTWFLTTYVLGARWEGGNRWSVRPAFDGVAYARGTLPLGEHGDLAVSWEQPICAQCVLSVTSPVDTHGEIVIPALDDTTLVGLNDEVVWQDGQPMAQNVFVKDEHIHVSLNDGVYRLEIERICP